MLTASPAAAPAHAPLPPRARAPLGGLPGLLLRRFDFLEEARARTGDIYSLDLPGARPIVLCHPRHAQHVFRDHAVNYRKGGGFWEVLRELFGDGIIVSEGERWLHQRRLMQPAFHRQRIAGLVDTMVAAIDATITSWPDSARPVDIGARTSAITMEVITRTMFGDGITRDEMDEVARTLPIVQNFTMVGTLTHGLPAWLPVPGRRRFRSARESLRAVASRLIERCRGRPGGALLTMLTEARDADTGQPMSEAQVLDEAIGIFLAGYETTSLALAWAIYLLMRHPDVMARLTAEADAALGGQNPTMADLPRLPYARQVLFESMRLYPPASWLPRTAVDDDVIDGVRIPAGTTVILPIYLYHRHPEFWPDPERFDPERFAPEPSEGRHPFAWMPFGGGQRLCIGKEFAILEGHLALAMLLQRLRFTPVDARPVRPLPTSTLGPQGGIWARVERRRGPAPA
ncbi:MAG TPA: cytochrome P450 [Nannocystaceae bacterium]|nr:cytochrome P450 [Nannocystaceae bacterium]